MQVSSGDHHSCYSIEGQWLISYNRLASRCVTQAMNSMSAYGIIHTSVIIRENNKVTAMELYGPTYYWGFPVVSRGYTRGYLNTTILTLPVKAPSYTLVFKITYKQRKGVKVAMCVFKLQIIIYRLPNKLVILPRHV